MYHFDVLFLDTTSPSYYDRLTLEKQAMGGTEATVVRIAEGLGALGLKIAVLQSRVPYFEPVMGQYAFYMHADDASKITCKHYIQLRVNGNPGIFPGSKKYLWMHDVAVSSNADWLPSLKANNTTVIGVSRWHKKNIQIITNHDNVTYIYNPVSDSIYIDANTPTAYDKNIIVWMASPHKGLGKALELFKIAKSKIPTLQLVVFNPGYFDLDSAKISVQPGVTVYGPMNCYSVWSIVQKSLCVFYPAQWIETFGLIAAEANALGTPILTYRKGALKEVVSSDLQFVEDHDETGILDKLVDWHTNGRPKVLGKDEFKTNNVIMEWIKLLAR